MKASSVVAGIALTLVLYGGVVYSSHLDEPRTRSHERGIESSSQRYEPSIQEGCHGGDIIFGLILWVPIFLFPIAVLTGFFIQPHIEKSWISFLFYSPATVFIVILICMVFLTEPVFTMEVLVVYGGICLIWLLSSCPGVALGYKLRAWISDWISRKFYN